MFSRDPRPPRRLLSIARSAGRLMMAAAIPVLLVVAAGAMSLRTGVRYVAPAAPVAQAQVVGGAVDVPSAPSATQPQAIAGAPPQFPTVGLGRGRAEWEREHSSGAAQGSWTTYENGRYWVQFKNNNVWHLDIHLSDAEAVPLPRAREVLRVLLPPDAKRISTYSPTEGTVVDVYQSNWLAQQYGNAVWPRGSRAGTLIVRNRVKDDLPGGNRVVWLGIEAGNDPAQNNP